VLERFPRKANILALILWICSGAGGAFAQRLNGTDHPLTDRIIPVYFGRYINPDNISVLNGLISSIGLAFYKADQMRSPATEKAVKQGNRILIQFLN
jgi:hypothetical protein